MRRALIEGVTVLAVCVLLGIAVTWLVAPSLHEGAMASGADTGSYLLTTQFIVDTYQETGSLQSINPAWYVGFAAFHNTPMPVYVPLVIFYFITGDILTTSHIAHIFFTLIMAIAAYGTLRPRYGHISAALGGLLFAATPIMIGQVTMGGSYPRALSSALGVACFHFIDKMADEGVTARRLLPVATLLAAATVAHPVTGVAFLGCWTVFFLAKTTISRSLKLPQLLAWAVVPLATFALSAWYLVPFFGERQGWTTFPDEIFEITSVTLVEGYGWLGWPVLAVVVIGVALTWRKPTTGALVISGLVSFILAAGYHTGIQHIVPAIKAAYPFVFLFYSAFAAGALATIGIDAAMRRKGIWRVATSVILLSALVAGSVTARDWSEETGQVAGGFKNPDDLATAEFVADYSNDGRYMTMSYPFSYLGWWLLGTSDKPGVEGWYFSLTPSGKHISWVYDALDHGFTDYAIEALDRWNVRQLVTNGNFKGPEYDRMVNELQTRGFTEEFVQGANRVFASAEPSRFVVPLKARTLVLGRYAPIAAAMIPGAIVGGSADVSSYPPEILSAFDTVILTGFSVSDRTTAEDSIETFASHGGHVVVDLGGMELSAIEDTANFLGVNGYVRVLPDGLTIDPVLETLGGAEMPAELELPAEPKTENGEHLTEWRFVAYPGLDRSFANEAGGDGFSILGSKNLKDGGQAVFVGGGLFYHAYRTGNAEEVELMRAIANPKVWNRSSEALPASVDLTGADAPQSTETMSLVIAEHETPTADEIKFDCSSDEDALVLVSWAYSPHWRAYVDGDETTVLNLDDLMVLNLPAGEHSVEMRYEGLSIHWIAWLISLATLALLIITYRRSWYRERDSRREHAELS